jgi:hypothetical protein
MAATSRWLFRLAYAAALGLVVAVVAAPWIDTSETATTSWQRMVALFAKDAVLRRTSLASAAGLLVTACVFFRSENRAPGPPCRPGTQGVAGA